MRYMGSKKIIAKDIAFIINDIARNYNIENYYEPFIGGGSIYELVDIKNKYGSDYNKYLIALYEEIIKNGDSRLPEEISKEHYNEVRDSYYKRNNLHFEDWYYSYVGFEWSFMSSWFNSYFRNPTGNKIRDLDEIRKFNITCCSYDEVQIKSPSIIYCDAPYVGTAQYSGVKNNFDFDKYYSWLIEQSKNNIVLISEYRMPSHFKCFKSFDFGKQSHIGDIANKNNNYTDEQFTTRYENLYYVNNGLGHEYFESLNCDVDELDF